MPLGSASYYIKAFYEQGFVEGETMDSMALSQSPGINMQINNPVSSPDQQLSYTIKTANKVKFIKVLARFNFYDEKEFYLYNIHEINMAIKMMIIKKVLIIQKVLIIPYFM